MPLNPFVEQRKHMKQMLMDMMYKHPDIQEKQLIAVFCLKTGVRERTALEYLKEIKDAQAFFEEQKLVQTTLQDK